MSNYKQLDLLSELNSTFTQQNWEVLFKLLDPKLFRTIESQKIIASPILAKVAQILTTKDATIPDDIKIASLKCLGNSCYNGYKNKEYVSDNFKYDNYCHKLYSTLAKSNGTLDGQCDFQNYPYDTHFPYEGVAEWATDYILSHVLNTEKLSEKQLDILRLSIQFLCNLFTFACRSDTTVNQYSLPKCLSNSTLKKAIMNIIVLDNTKHYQLIRASCAFIHNALKELQENYFTESEKKGLCSQLLKPISDGVESAKDALLHLLHDNIVLQWAYNDMLIEDKLYLLEIIYNEISGTVYSSNETNACNVFTKDTIEFLSEKFCKRSDLILKTVSTYTNEVEPTEIIILLDILGVLTSGDIKEFNFLKFNKSLLINCTYLLKSIQMVGKESNNCFTPVQKLSEVAPAMSKLTIDNERIAGLSATTNNENQSKVGEEQPNRSLHDHPAFGFKAGLIRIMGNMCYKNRACQDLLREMDAIPLLLDCCNIDARNPLIMQWTIFALRNLCEGNLENQEIIRGCTKVGTVENSVLKEVGLTLHEEEDGKKIGIVPLSRDTK